jgi:hypothetical protein
MWIFHPVNSGLEIFLQHAPNRPNPMLDKWENKRENTFLPPTNLMAVHLLVAGTLEDVITLK